MMTVAKFPRRLLRVFSIIVTRTTRSATEVADFGIERFFILANPNDAGTVQACLRVSVVNTERRLSRPLANQCATQRTSLLVGHVYWMPEWLITPPANHRFCFRTESVHE